MEQATRTRAHFERILLVCGLPNAGKSTLLRQMFVDPRLGGNGAIPTTKRLRPVALSRERRLFVRLSSPHETRGETLDGFIEKIDLNTARAWNDGFWRVNFACPLQPHARGGMPNVPAICQRLHDEFWPERIRIVQIDPRQDGTPGALLSAVEVDQLRGISGVEVMTVDARRPLAQSQRPNGLLLADFFDFT